MQRPLLFALATLLVGCSDSTTPDGTPPAVGNVVAISAGGSHTCALRVDGKAFCWGSNTAGQLGDGTQEDRLNPTPVSGGLTFAEISAGYDQTCGVTSGSQVYCWGNNVQGQVGGDGAAGPIMTPLLAASMTFTTVSAGQNHSCGISSGNVYCWGTGYLGDDSTSKRRPYPVLVPGGPWSLVSAASSHSCAVRATGSAYCWGSNAGGLLGIGTTTGQSFTPAAVVGGHTFTAIDAALNHTCAIATDGTPYCWGNNANGQLGTGATGAPVGTPSAVSSPFTFSEIASGEDFTCAAFSDGTHCWGNNGVAQLGFTADNSPHPTPTKSDALVESISAFGRHACGINGNFDGYCWGNDQSGQIGDGRTAAAVAIPFKISLP